MINSPKESLTKHGLVISFGNTLLRWENEGNLSNFGNVNVGSNPLQTIRFKNYKCIYSSLGNWKRGVTDFSTRSNFNFLHNGSNFTIALVLYPFNNSQNGGCFIDTCDYTTANIGFSAALRDDIDGLQVLINKGTIGSPVVNAKALNTIEWDKWNFFYINLNNNDLQISKLTRKENINWLWNSLTGYSILTCFSSLNIQAESAAVPTYYMNGAIYQIEIWNKTISIEIIKRYLKNKFVGLL